MIVVSSLAREGLAPACAWSSPVCRSIRTLEGPRARVRVEQPCQNAAQAPRTAPAAFCGLKRRGMYCKTAYSGFPRTSPVCLCATLLRLARRHYAGMAMLVALKIVYAALQFGYTCAQLPQLDKCGQVICKPGLAGNERA